MSDLGNVKFYGRGDQDIELDIDPFLDDIIRNIVGDTDGGLSVTMVVTPGDAAAIVGVLIITKGITIEVTGTLAKALGIDPILSSPIVIKIDNEVLDYEGIVRVFGLDPIISEPGVTIVVSGGLVAVYGNDPLIIEGGIIELTGQIASATGNEPTITNEYVVKLTGTTANATIGTLTIINAIILGVFSSTAKAKGIDPIITNG